jgi:hypothetical protein
MPLLKILPSLISQGSFTGSFSGTGSYARRALTASYVLGGAAGSSGTSGANGTSGSSGSSGANGTSGSSGNSGTSGSSGTSATAGSSGTSGVGSPGTSGSSGSSGTSGSSGNSGTSGSSGGTGSSGTSGAGSPGSSGSSGTSTTPALSLGQTYIGNGSTTTYALSQSVANRDQILVNVDGVLQGRSGNYYTVSGTTLTLSSPPQNGSIIDIRYINGGSGIVTTGSLAKQTILYNVVSGSQNVITGLNLSGNKWGVDIKEEWDAVTVTGDQYYNSCSLLMHFNGANGSTTFTDNSPSPKTVTSNNGSAISTAQSKFGGGSGFFDGTDDYLSINYNSAFNFGTNSFTWETWIYPTNISGIDGIYATSGGSGVNPKFVIHLNAGTPSIHYNNLTNGSDIYTTATSAVSINTWTHLAFVRNGSNWTWYINGNSAGSGTNNTNITFTSQPTYIGYGGESYFTPFNGYIDELRVTKGVARYTSNFTPQTSEFPNNASITQYATKYVGLIGGLNDKSVDYGVQKLSDTSLKVVKMSQTTSPFPSGSLSSSVDRVYVNVLDYSKVYVTSSYSLNSINSLDIPKIKSIIYTNSSYTPTTASAIDLFKPNTSYITISGSNFKPSASIFIDNTSGSVVTYVNSNKLNVNVISKNEGTYPIYLMNTDGASAFKINAITYITSQDQFQYLVLAGGGGGGIAHAGGGGAGGFRTGSLGLNRSVPYTISVGSGGSSSPSRSVNGTNGGNSVFASITSTGGGGGGSEYKPANPGGSGGGGATQGAGGSGTVSQGNNGGAGSPTSPPYAGGGGGGAGAIGGSYTPGSGGNGGNGLISNISSTPIYYAGGGGGGVYGGYAGITNRGAGGLGGGGNGNYGNGNGSAGEASRGGGGGGGGYPNENGYNGGSGIVIVKYLSSRTLTIGVGLTSSTVITGSYKITTFTAGSDTITIS